MFRLVGNGNRGCLDKVDESLKSFRNELSLRSLGSRCSPSRQRARVHVHVSYCTHLDRKTMSIRHNETISQHRSRPTAKATWKSLRNDLPNRMVIVDNARTSQLIALVASTDFL